MKKLINYIIVKSFDLSLKLFDLSLKLLDSIYCARCKCHKPNNEKDISINDLS